MQAIGSNDGLGRWFDDDDATVGVGSCFSIIHLKKPPAAPEEKGPAWGIRSKGRPTHHHPFGSRERAPERTCRGASDRSERRRTTTSGCQLCQSATRDARSRI